VWGEKGGIAKFQSVVLVGTLLQDVVVVLYLPARIFFTGLEICRAGKQNTSTSRV